VSLGKCQIGGAGRRRRVKKIRKQFDRGGGVVLRREKKVKGSKGSEKKCNGRQGKGVAVREKKWGPLERPYATPGVGSQKRMAKSRRSQRGVNTLGKPYMRCLIDQNQKENPAMGRTDWRLTQKRKVINEARHSCRLGRDEKGGGSILCRSGVFIRGEKRKNPS